MKDKLKVICISNGDLGRAQMSAALLGDRSGGIVDVCYYTESPGASDEEAVAALAELGIDAKDHCFGTTLEDDEIDLAVIHCFSFFYTFCFPRGFGNHFQHVRFGDLF